MVSAQGRGQQAGPRKQNPGLPRWALPPHPHKWRLTHGPLHVPRSVPVPVPAPYGCGATGSPPGLNKELIGPVHVKEQSKLNKRKRLLEVVGSRAGEGKCKMSPDPLTSERKDVPWGHGAVSKDTGASLEELTGAQGSNWSEKIAVVLDFYHRINNNLWVYTNINK